MALIFDVVYPNGEHAVAIGYGGRPLVVNQVPRGPESCLFDELEVATHSTTAPCAVVRILGGPRRPTHRVRVIGGELAREQWMAAREVEGWDTLDGHDEDPDVVWVVATADGLDASMLDVMPRR